jgi:hypothetical protein
MKSRKSTSAYCALILTFFSWWVSASEPEGLVEPVTPEVVYLFSYHCGGCYAMHEYVNLWHTTASGVNTTFLPVFGTDEFQMAGARFHYLLKGYAHKHGLSSLKRTKMGFVLTEAHPNIATRAEFMSVMRDKGMVFTVAEFVQWWKDSELALEQAELMLARAREIREVVTPLAMVWNGSTSWVEVNVDSDNPGVKFVSDINASLRKD